MAGDSQAGRMVSTYFAATPEESARVAAAPSLGADANWQQFASAVHQQVIEAYQQGEISLERALQAVRSCSVRCTWQDRLTLMALTAVQALEHPPTRKKKQVRNPLWIRRSAAQLVQLSRQARPSEAFAPNAMNDWTTPILEAAIVWLRALDLCHDLTPRVLYKWYSDAKRAGVLQIGRASCRERV